MNRMKLLTVFVCLLILSTPVVQPKRRLKGIFLAICHLKCSLSQFNCNCESAYQSNVTRDCIARTSLCDGWQDCPDGSDELDCTCPPDQYQCGCDTGGNCFANAIYECKDIGDTSSCNSLKNVDGSCTVPPVPCNGVINCPWDRIHDEIGCSECPPEKPNRCKCNSADTFDCHGGKYTCYANDKRCNRKADCSDSSDETGCPCKEDEFKCQCYRKDPVTCPLDSACVPLHSLNNGVNDCSDASDETPFKNVISSHYGDVTMWRFDNTMQCASIMQCNVSSCYTTPSLNCIFSNCTDTDWICMSADIVQSISISQLSEIHPFQCSDGSLLITSQFCNNVVDCADDSDEIRNQPGFKCLGPVGNCVLPQRNLHDDIPQCADRSDLCLDGLHQCFQCLDQRLLVSSKQVCDGIMDCYDFSDECFCSNGPHPSFCDNFVRTNRSATLPSASEATMATRLINDDLRFEGNIFQGLNISTVRCRTKWGERTAILCDGRPECRDFSDECGDCENTPNFCSDPCHSFYPLGDRYCDGFVDEAWVYINDSACPRGFDEQFCPKRFKCEAANDMVSIDIRQVCDGTKNCNDGSDERDCIFMTNANLVAATTTSAAITFKICPHALILMLILVLFI